MNAHSGHSVDACREFIAAVEFVSELERSSGSVWDAIADALAEWADLVPARAGSSADPLRSVLRELLETTPEVGAPGGVHLGAIIEAAITDWAAAASARVNDGHPFTR
ncbi:MAG: hypothetical protein CL424_10210 [Acidimicrobiaceae bacterium]|nr:hypothetical protein [Acidimicrobiaceae bacterium]